MVALWRGGTPVGICVHEILKWKKIPCDHIAIRTSRYTGVDLANEEVVIHNLSYLEENLQPGDSILIVDDVWDKGTTMDALFKKLRLDLGDKLYDSLDIRVATVYYKPKRSKYPFKPKYFVHESDDWLVFPHELEGLSIDDIETHLGSAIANIVKSC